MAQPAAFPIALYLDGTDRTAFIPYDSLRLDDNLADVSTLSFVVEDATGFTPAPNMKVRLLTADLQEILFDGIISDLRTTRRGVVTDYEITASDNKIRLQKAVTKPGIYTGNIEDILRDLLRDSFPALDDDFNIDVGDVPDGDYSFEVGDDSVLDTLKRIGDELGLDLAVEQPELTGSNSWLVTFDAGGETDYSLFSSNISMAVESGQGQPDPIGEGTNAWYGEREFERTYAPSSCDVQVTPGSSVHTFEILLGNFTRRDGCKISDIKFDYKVTVSNPGKFTHTLRISRMRVFYWDGSSLQLGDNLSNVATLEPDENNNSDVDVWKTVTLTDVLTKDVDFTVDTLARVELTFTGNVEGWDNGPPCDTEVVDYSVALDNFRLVLDPTSPVEPTDPTDPVEDVNPTITIGDGSDAPFDFDIDTGDEYLKDLIIDESQDDYNAVVIIGGTVKEAFDWTYESDGEQDHFDLELPISDYTIYVNVGTDATPVWATLTAGIRGKDDLQRRGGSAAVIYDASYHWLEFEDNPPALAKAFRVKGFIEKSIRIAVDETAAGEPTLAMPLYDSTVTSEDAAVQRAKAELDKRNGPQRIQFTTYEPGLRPGMVLGFEDDGRGLSASATIQRVSVKWLGGSGHATFDVTAGPGEELGAAQLIADNDKRSRQKTAPGGVSDIATIGILLDDDSNELTDDSDRVLYEVT